MVFIVFFFTSSFLAVVLAAFVVVLSTLVALAVVVVVSSSWAAFLGLVVLPTLSDSAVNLEVVRFIFLTGVSFVAEAGVADVAATVDFSLDLVSCACVEASVGLI